MLLADVGNRPGVVLVTSALPNEGKSSIVVSLARVLAGAGRAVVVVDCDLRRPSVHGLFGAKDGPGLVECVTGKASLDHVIQEDKQTSVHFIRAGERSTNSPDIFDSVAFQQLLKTLSRNYDMVLLDSPPVLAARQQDRPGGPLGADTAGHGLAGAEEADRRAREYCGRAAVAGRYRGPRPVWLQRLGHLFRRHEEVLHGLTAFPPPSASA
jgi:hypothetical protein